MASSQSSHDMWRGRGRQPQILGNAQPRHRSESRRLSERRWPVNTVHKRDHCPGALHVGDAIRVFSRSADKWVDGEVVKLVEDNFARVEYGVHEYWCGKTLHLHSQHLLVPFPVHDVCHGSKQLAVSETCHPPLNRTHLGMDTLRQHLLRRCTSNKVSDLSPPSDFVVDVENYGYAHVKSGVFVHSQPIRLCQGGSYQVLFHYTQKQFFDKIVQTTGADSIQKFLLKASRDLERDCDFGVGVYATEKGPDEFPDGIKGILLNNYPRKGPWGFAGEPGEEYHYLASYCIPILVPRHWTKCFPLSSDISSPTIYGPIRELKMRQGYAFDPDRHNICVILNPDVEQLGELVDAGPLVEQQIKDEIDEFAANQGREPVHVSEEEITQIAERGVQQALLKLAKEMLSPGGRKKLIEDLSKEVIEDEPLGLRLSNQISSAAIEGVKNWIEQHNAEESD